jgi:hypothetical protein
LNSGWTPLEVFPDEADCFVRNVVGRGLECKKKGKDSGFPVSVLAKYHAELVGGIKIKPVYGNGKGYNR